MDRIKQVRDYIETDRDSKSAHKAIIRGIGTYKTARSNMFKESTQHFLIGSAVDCKLTTPEIFDDLYHITVTKKPSEKVASIIQEVYAAAAVEIKTTTSKMFFALDAYRDFVLLSCTLHEYYPNWGDDAKIKNIIRAGEHYFEELKSSNGKDILTTSELELINKIANSLTSSPVTSKYFECSATQDIIYQLPIYFDYSGVKCKALLDMVKIDHSLKTILPIDIKTIGNSTKAFNAQSDRFGYQIQAAWYTLAICIWRDSKYPEYTVLPFKFLVESTKSPGVLPLCYTVTSHTLNVGEWGGTVINSQFFYNVHASSEPIHNCRIIKGYRQALELYKWHTALDMWDMDRDIYEAQGELKLDSFIK
jgi:hypothetical protein